MVNLVKLTQNKISYINKNKKNQDKLGTANSKFDDISDFEYTIISIQKINGSYYVTYSNESEDYNTTPLKAIFSKTELIDKFSSSMAYLLGFLACESSLHEELSTINTLDTI